MIRSYHFGLLQHKSTSCPIQLNNESNSPDRKKRLNISHNQPGIGFFKTFMICIICVESACFEFGIRYGRTKISMNEVLAFIIRSETGKAYHLIFVLAAVIIMMMFLRFLAMSVAITVAMIVMDIMTRM